VFRGNVSTDDVESVLRSTLGSHYQLVPLARSKGFTKQVPGDNHSLLVKGRWLARANIVVIPGDQVTAIEISPGASYFGLVRLFDRMGIARRVRRTLESAPELAP
jgi:hypothetical protein